MKSPAPETQAAAELFAFLFTDIEGSSRKWLNHRMAMQEALAHHDAMLRQAIAAHGGEVFKTAGDAFYAVFSRPADAANAAIAAQRALAAHDFTAVDGLKVRMAVQFGAAEKRAGDYFGPALNRCARLMALGHGGQVLLASPTAELLASERNVEEPARLIGRTPLDDPAQPVPIYQVLIAGLQQKFPALRDAQARPTNLPKHLTALIGREHELVQIAALFTTNAMVTLTGSGGVGKTRLAVAAGWQQLSDFAAGVWCAELAPLHDPALVSSSVATCLGIDLSDSKAAVDVLVERLKTQQLLLILDNCEHVIGSVAALSERLLSACPDVRILATSQEPIGIAGEAVWRLATLALPSADAATAEQAMGSAAVALFVARAKTADPRFVLDDRNAPTVTAICRRLDGVALAIEMAAARVAAFGITAVAQKLDERFRILAGGRRTALPRHQTLRATLDWSHSLLPERERVVLRRLSVLAGSFTLGGAGAVASDERFDEFDVADAVTALTSKSLVNDDAGDEPVRYRLMETTRDYAGEKLEAARETAAMRRRHAAYMAAVFEQCYADSQDTSDAIMRASYAPELDNLRLALDWAFAAEGDEALGLALAGTLEPMFSVLALLSEARQRLEDAAARIRIDTPPLHAARIWESLGRAFGFSQPSKAFDALARALPLRRANRDERALGSLLVYMGRIAQVIASRAGEADALIAEAEPLIERAGTARIRAQLCRMKGNRAASAGDFARSIDFMRQSQQLFHDAGAHAAANAVQNSLSYIVWSSGDLDAAIEACRAILAHARSVQFPNPHDIGVALGNLGGMLTEHGDLDEARAVFGEAAPLLREPWQLWVYFDHIALAHAKANALDAAARAVGFCDAEYHAHGAARQLNEQRAHRSVMARLRAALAEDQLVRLMAEGAALAPLAALALASFN